MQMSRTVIVKATLTLWRRPASSKKTYFKQIPLLWTGFRLISIRMAKNEAYFPSNRTQLSSGFFFHACAQATILTWTWTFLANLFRSFSLAPLFSFAFLLYQQFCCPFYRLSFAWNCGWPTFQERDKYNLQRVVGKQRNQQSIFPQNVTFFVSVTLLALVRISKTRYCWKDLYFLTLLLTNILKVASSLIEEH